MKKLEIKIKSAEFNDQLKEFRLDPFAEIIIDNQMFTTKCHDKGGKHPKWDEEIIMNLENIYEGKISIFTIINNNKLCIGKCNFDFSQLKNIRLLETSFNLKNEDNIVVGVIYLNFDLIIINKEKINLKNNIFDKKRSKELPLPNKLNINYN